MVYAYCDGVPHVYRARRTNLTASVDFDGDHGPQPGVTENIGLGGLFVATRRDLRVGEHVTLRFGLPDADGRLVLEAEVRWVRKSDSVEQSGRTRGAGVRFVKMSLHAVAVIDHCLRSQTTRE